MEPVNRLFSNLREVMFGMMLSSVGMVPVSCKQAGWSRCVCKLSKQVWKKEKKNKTLS